MEKFKFVKEHKNDKVWWVEHNPPIIGAFEFSFDKEKIFNLFRDYPHNLTKEQIEIFDKENPFWAEFFGRRKK